MKKKLNNLLDRLEKRAGEIVSLKAALASEKEQSAQYYKWWQDEEAKVTELEEALTDKEEAVTKGIEIQVNE